MASTPSETSSSSEEYAWNSVKPEAGPVLPSTQSLVGLQPNRMAFCVSVVAGNMNLQQKPEDVDNLLDMYWRYLHPLCPILDRQKTVQEYQRIINGSVKDLHNDSGVAILDLMLALASQLLEFTSYAERKALGRIYYARASFAKPLLSHIPICLESLEHMLLAISFLQNPEHAVDMGEACASLIRMAMELDLDDPDTSVNEIEETECQRLRQLWHTCVLMDRKISLKRGCDTCLSDAMITNVPMPLAHDKVDWDSDLTAGPDASFLLESLMLTRIMQNYTWVYPKPIEQKVEMDRLADNVDKYKVGITIVTGALEINALLEHWRDHLPASLRNRLSDPPDPRSLGERPGLILRLQFLHAQILVLRPILSIFHHREPKPTQLAITSLLASHHVASLECILSAQEIISTLASFKALGDGPGMWPPWWERIHLAYTAANVIMLNEYRPEYSYRESLKKSWNQAMDVLEAHDRCGPWARRALKALHGLSTTLQGLKMQKGGLPKCSERELPPDRALQIGDCSKVLQGFVMHMEQKELVPEITRIEELSELQSLSKDWASYLVRLCEEFASSQ